MVQHHPPGKIIPVDLSKFFWDPFSSNSAPLGFFAASGFKGEDQRRTNFLSFPQEISQAREKAMYLTFFLVIENGEEKWVSRSFYYYYNQRYY